MPGPTLMVLIVLVVIAGPVVPGAQQAWQPQPRPRVWQPPQPGGARPLPLPQVQRPGPPITVTPPPSQFDGHLGCLPT